MDNKEIIEHLHKLKIYQNDNILVYSKLSSFGITDKNFTKEILQNLYRKVGKKGSVFMPLYTFERSKRHIFDKRKIYQNEMTGILNKEFFKNKKIVRSDSPIHSHIGIGPIAKFLTNSDSRTSFGGESDFHFFYKNNFKLILLGCNPQDSATYLHHLEAIINVNYRKWIIVKKKVYDFKNKKYKLLHINFFALKNNKIKYDFNKFFNKIIKLGARTKKIKLMYGSSYSISIKSLHKFGLMLLKKDKKSLLVK